METYKTKDVNIQPVDVDENGTVKTIWSKTDTVDHDGDSITATAFNKTLKERGPKGKSLIYHLTDHNWKYSNSFIGKPKELYMDQGSLVAITDIDLKTNPHGAFMHARYIKGEVNQHSIGFRVISGDTVETSKGQYYEIREVALREGSAVLWGANEETPTLDAKYIDNPNLLLVEIESTYENFKKYLKTGLTVEDTYFLGQDLESLIRKAKALTSPHKKHGAESRKREDYNKIISEHFKGLL